MKCTNSKRLLLLCLAGSLLTGCQGSTLPAAYRINHPASAFQIDRDSSDEKLDTFASALAVGNADVTEGTDVNMENATAAGLIDVRESRIIYSKNMHERLAPASLTKILTAILALKYGNPDDVIHVTEAVKIDEPGATLCGLKAGDTLTLNQALHALLIQSANDAGNAIAVHIGGTIEAFADMMNEEARMLGATNSHFVNPHGLSDDNHYSTAYDMYLLFNEAIQYEMFREIIHMDSYSTIYQDADGNDKQMEFSTTNLFLRGDYNSPDKITIIGGKTGTTNAAGSCLIMLSRDAAGKSYISVILRSSERAIMYEEMIDLLEEIYN